MDEVAGVHGGPRAQVQTFVVSVVWLRTRAGKARSDTSVKVSVASHNRKTLRRVRPKYVFCQNRLALPALYWRARRLL